MTDKYHNMWDRWARIWDFVLSVVGFDIAFRELAVDKLNLNVGDVVLDLACGTGLNFAYLERKVGKEGKIIALDYSSEMLKKAEEKIEQQRWRNITLFERDASDFELDEKVDAVLCTWSMVSIPDYEKALKKSIDVLKEGGKYVVLDFQLMSGIKGLILNPFYKMIFKATRQDVTREPWKNMKHYLRGIKKENHSGLLASYYIAAGQKMKIT
jgi:ubiquinone/menaquinone biosynthesis C-methylase UbiE